MHSSKTSAERLITTHFRESAKRSRMAAGPCVLGWGKGWGEQDMAIHGLEKAATDLSKRKDFMVMPFMGSYLNTCILPGHSRGTHQCINLHTWSLH